jgi:hypothetical protein
MLRDYINFNSKSDTMCCLIRTSYIYNSCIFKDVEDELDQLQNSNQITDSVEDDVVYNARGKNVGSLFSYLATILLYSEPDSCLILFFRCFVQIILSQKATYGGK